jgi:hypothetical protein
LADRELAGNVVQQRLVANASTTNLRFPVTPDGGEGGLTVEERTIVVMSHELSSCGIWPVAGTFPPISAFGPYDQFLAAVYLLVVQLPFSHRIAALRIALESFAGYEGGVTGYLLGWMVKCEFAIHGPTRWDRRLTGAQIPWGVHQKGMTQVTHLRGV